MILIADGGSTKCDWIVARANGEVVEKIRTQGINPALLDLEAIGERLLASEGLAKYNASVKEVYFYGAGCGLETAQGLLEKALRSVFLNATVVLVREDLAAAVFSCGREPAVVGILGTGSNCCYFDGNEIVIRQPSLGFMIMDDGSGNYLGKSLLRAYYYEWMPAALREKFAAAYPLDPITVKTKLYKEENTNAYLAGFAKFIFDHPQEAFLTDIFREAIVSFVETHLKFYKEELKTLPVHFVGSVAFYGKEIITEVLQEYGYRAGAFVRRPIDRLVEHHTQ